MISARFIVLLIIVASAAPLVVGVLGLPGPNVQDPNALDVFGSPTGPSAAHPFGVDQLGRDIALPGHLRRAGLARGGDRRYRGRRRGRHGDRAARRLLPPGGRHGADAWGRRVPRVPGSRAGARHRRGVRRPRLPQRADPARARDGDLHHCNRQFHHLRANRARPGALAAREGVHRGIAVPGRFQHEDHLPRDPAQPARAPGSLFETC